MDMPPEAANPYANPDTAAIYDQMRQTVSPKEFSDEVLAGASQVDPEEVAKFKAELEQLEVPMEVLDMLNNMVDEILANPDNYEQVKQKYEAMGVTDDLLPDAFDGEFFSALNMAVDQMIAEPAGAQAFAKGGIAELSPISKAVASYGRNGDTMLAHITPAEARMLRRRGGAGTTNPDTGLKEYFSLKKLFKGIGNAVKSFASSTVGRVVTTVALGFFLGPAAASAMGIGAGTAAAAAVGGFVGGAGSTLLAGGNLKDALKAGAIGGFTMGAIEGFSGAPLTGGTAAPGSFSDIVGGQVDVARNKLSGMFGGPTADITTNTARDLTRPAIDASGGVKGLAPTDVTQAPYRPLEMTGMPVKPFDAPYDPTGSRLFPDYFGTQPPVGQPAIPSFNPEFPAGDPGAGFEPYNKVFADAPARVRAPVGFTEAPVGANEQVYRAPSSGMADVTTNTARDLTRPADTSYFNQAKDIYNKNFSPSGIQAQAEPLARQAAADAVAAAEKTIPASIQGEARNAMLKSTYDSALKAAMPGIVGTYGPMAAVGIGALALGGGFKPTSAAPSTLRPELMKPVTQRIAEGGNQRNYYVQGLPGVKYDQYGAPIFGQNVPLPTFETGLGITALMNPKGYADGGSIAVGYAGGGSVSEADKEAAKRAFELANPNGLGPSVNIGGYGTLNFQNDAAYDQFNKNPQSMTFSQGPGGVRYVEPQAMDYGDMGGGIGGLGGGMGGKPSFDEQGNATMAFADGGSVTAANFDSAEYLKAYPDAAAALARGDFPDAYSHYLQTERLGEKRTATKILTTPEQKAAAQAANRKAVADAKTAKKAAGFTGAYQNINAGLSYDAPAGIAATAIAARQAAFKPTMDKFTQAQAANTATLAKPYTPTVVDQPYNNTKGYENVLNPVAPPINYDTTPVGMTAAEKAAMDAAAAKAAADKAAADKAAADKAAADKIAAEKAAIAAADRARFQGQSLAVQNQQIMDYLKANPNATDQTFAQQMDYFGIKSPQVAQVVGMQNLPAGSVQSIDARYAQGAAANAGNAAAIAAQTKANAVTGQSIQDYFAKNPGMTDRQIADYMDANQIDPAQMERAFAGTAGAISAPDVFARYQEATRPLPNASISFSNAARNLNAERGIAPPVALPGSFPANGGNFEGYDFIPDARLPEGMSGTLGGSGYDPVTGRVDLGSGGGSGQYVRRADSLPTSPAAGNDFKHMAMTDEFGNIITAPPTPPQTKLLNMGGIASLGSGGYPRRTGQISGPGTATSDSIPAMLSDGEFVMTAKAVRGAGKGDKRAGAKRMYALMNQLEKNAARG
jgi:hypothetical protein